MARPPHTKCLCHAVPFVNRVENCMRNAILKSTPKQYQWRIMRYELQDL